MQKVQHHKEYKDITETLEECNVYGERGYKLANDAVLLLTQAINSASMNLQSALNSVQQSNLIDRNSTIMLSKHLSDIRFRFERLPLKLRNDIDMLSQNTFSIALFGRTMAGKSTLMEILTHGNGTSIGKGAQRTTRDVRTYSYKGLFVTDVPGIAAFEGTEDEQVAFDAAKKADLVLFLITDDAPQAQEAQCLKNILGLGKPVICLVNVKVAIDDKTNLKIFKRDLEKKFDNNRLETIKNQFLDFGKQYGQDWHNISFNYVHLKSAFFSQQKSFETISGELYGLSHFSEVVNLILKEVRKNGAFYKLKAFSDVVVVPMVEMVEVLFNQSAQNSQQGTILIEKNRNLESWSKNFWNKAKQGIETFLTRISSDLNSEIAEFVENNYDKPSASDEWNRILKAYDVNGKAECTLNQLDKEAKDKIREMIRETDAELKYFSVTFSDANLNMDPIRDYKRAWNWIGTILNGGVLLAGLFMGAPVAAIAFVTGGIFWLISNCFDDVEDKRSRARKKLEQKLSGHIRKLIYELRKKMKDILRQETFNRQIYALKNTISERIDCLFNLSEIQWKLAISVNKKLQEVNMAFIREAFIYLGYGGMEREILSVARIPGYAVMLVLKPGVNFPGEASKALARLLKEKVWFIIKNENKKSELMQSLWNKADREKVARDKVTIQKIKDVPRIAHIPFLDNVDENTKSRIRMAQQITELLIMK